MKLDWLKQIGFSLLALAVGVYLVMQLSLSVGTDVTIDHAIHMTVRTTNEMNAYLFRSETPISAGESGTVCYCVADGTKVTKNETVALVYSHSDDASIQEKIQKLDARIDVLKRSSTGDGTSTSDIGIINGRIDELRLTYLKALADDDMPKAIRAKQDLTVMMNRSKALSEKTESFESQIKLLEQEKSELESTLTGSSAKVASPGCGYYYSSMDGYEGYFTADALSKITVDGFDELSGLLPDTKLLSSSAGKLVTSEVWYLLCRTDKRTAASYTTGRSYKVVFPYSSGIELTFTFTRKITQTDTDDCLMLLSCNVMPEGYSFTRSLTVELADTSYDGLRIPAQALRIKDGNTGVYVLDGNLVIFKNAVVLCKQGAYYICQLPKDPDYPSRNNVAFISKTELSLYDAVITSGAGIYEGALLQ